MTLERVREILASECKKAGTAKAWAESHAMSSAYVSDVLNGRKEPGEKILIALRLERVVNYQRAAE